MATQVILDQGGLAEIRAAANRYRDQLAVAIAGDMRRYVPVLTGDLRDSIREDLGGPAVARVWAGDVAAGVDYHLFQEFGTSVTSAQPYMRPAAYQYRS